MIFHYFKKILKLTTPIFTVIVLFQLLAGQNLNNTILYEFLFFSLIAAAIKLIFAAYIPSEYLIFHHLSYIILIWILSILSNIIFNWNLSLNSMLSTFVEIILIYICVRFINYQHDKSEVAKMNEILERNRKNKLN